MIVVEDMLLAILFMLLSLLFLGSWPVFFNILERRGRLPQHTYLDYAVTNFLVASLFALIFGQLGKETSTVPNFIPQLQEENWPSVALAMAGGFALCLGNILMQYSLAFLGISLTEVVSASLAVVGGDDVGNNNIVKNISECVQHGKLHDDIAVKQQYRVGSKQNFQLLEQSRAIKVRGSSIFLGLAIAFLTGTCYAMFSPLFNLATNDQFHLLKPGVSHLSVYTTFFYFSSAFFILAIVVNVCLLYFPLLGLPTSSLSGYLSDNKGRHFAIMAGFACGLGNGFQFIGGQAAGYAAADAVQALPLVGTFWGVVLFGEYKNSSRKTYILLAGMLTMFATAVALLIASSRERKN